MIKSEPSLRPPSATHFIHFGQITAALQSDMDEECEKRALDFFPPSSPFMLG